MNTPAFSIYNASAGSGKTYTLVKEYLKIILKSTQNDTYKNILAITFTNKAVFEMKSRIVDSLFDFSKDNPTEDSLQLMAVLEGEIGLNSTQIKNKAQTIIKSIIHNYAAFDISTIDKFTHKVIRAFAFDLGLPNTFDVSLDTEKLLQEAVDAIIAKAGDDEQLTKLLVDFTMEKTDDDKSWDVSSEIMNTGKLILNENYRTEILSFQDKTIPEFTATKVKLEILCKELESENVAIATKALQLIDDNNISRKSFSRETFSNHLIFIQKGELKITHKKFKNPDDIAINKNAIDRDIISSISSQLIDMLLVVYKNIEKKDFYEAFLKNITPLSLINTVNQELAKIQEEQNILSISEFNKLIFDHIQNQPAPFIYERLGEKYKHFFIDEFQDTSEMQWQNMIPLIDNSLSSENLQGIRGSLMIVGDPKQSIYRWRGGKAEQFLALAKAENPFSNKDKKVFDLETNFRSYSEIINFNNNFFKFLSSKFLDKDYQDLYENKSFQKANSKIGGFVNISFINKDDVELVNEFEEETPDKDAVYLQKTLQTINQVLEKGFLYSEIALLTRSKKHGVLLANFLTENKIPVISSESLLINASSEVQFILNLLKYLNNKQDIESLANALYYIAKNVENKIEIHDFIYTSIQFKQETDLEKWLATFNINISFQNIRRKSLYEAVESLVMQCIPTNKNNAYIQFFLDLVLERSVKYQFNISDFLNYWNLSGQKVSIPSSESANAIRIMTIHKSKGLEFPVVIFPFADENFSAAKREKMWIDATTDDINFDKFLIDKSSKVAQYGDQAAAVYSKKTQEDLLDNINVLYVALTRAREQLYIISSIAKRNKAGDLPNTLAAFFIHFLEFNYTFNENVETYNFGQNIKVSKPKTNQNEQKYIQPLTSVLKSESIKIAQREALMWGSEQIKAIEFGNIIHEILAFIGKKSDFLPAINKAIQNGLITISQKSTVEKIISDIIFHKDLAEFFDDKAEIFNERFILKNNFKSLKPDRVAIIGNNAYLLDYKTGKHQNKYQIQLNEYKMALEEMKYTVQKTVLVYISDGIEIVHL